MMAMLVLDAHGLEPRADGASAVDHERLPVTKLPASGEEDGGAGDLVRLADAAQRR